MARPLTAKPPTDPTSTVAANLQPAIEIAVNLPQPRIEFVLRRVPWNIGGAPQQSARWRPNGNSHCQWNR